MKNILWIEDEPLIGIDKHIIMLKDKGYDVTLLSDVREVLTLADKDQSPSISDFDLLILDIMMPPQHLSQEDTKGGYETGYALMKLLRDKGIEIPVIVVTGYPSPELEHRFKEEIVSNYYLSKPLSQVELEKVISEIIG